MRKEEPTPIPDLSAEQKADMAEKLRNWMAESPDAELEQTDENSKKIDTIEEHEDDEHEARVDAILEEEKNNKKLINRIKRSLKRITSGKSSKKSADLDYIDDDDGEIEDLEEENAVQDIQEAETEDTRTGNERLSDDFDHLKEAAEKKGITQKTLSWLQRNSSLRIATGTAIAGIAALTGGGVGTMAARIAMGGVSGAIGLSGLRAGKRESAAVKEFNESFGYKELLDENGQVDVDKLSKIIERDHEAREKAIELYASLTEVATAKGMQINSVLRQKIEDEENKAKELANGKNLQAYVQKYKNLHWGKKLALGVGLSVGMGFLGAYVGAGVGAGTLGRILFSGATQLGMGILQKTPEGASSAFAHSDKIEALKKALEETGGITEEDSENIQNIREGASSSRSWDVFVGAGLGAGVLATISILTNHHFEHSNHSSEHTAGNTDQPDSSPAPEPSAKGPDNAPDQDSPIPNQPNGSQPEAQNHVTIHSNKFDSDSSSFTDEINKAKGEIDTTAGASDRYATKMVEGLEGKGQINFANQADKENFIRGMSQALREHDGFKADGSISDVDALKHADPLELAKQTADQVNKGAKFEGVDHNAIAAIRDRIHGDGNSHNIDNHTTDSHGNHEQAAQHSDHHDTNNDGSHEPSAHHQGHTSNNDLHGNDTSSNEQEAASQHAEKADPSGFRWKAGRVEDYNKGIKLDKGQLQRILDNKLLKPDAQNYLDNLVKSGRIEPDQVTISKDGSHIMFADKGLSKDLVWDTSLKPRGFLGGLFGSKPHEVVQDVLNHHKSGSHLSSHLATEQTPYDQSEPTTNEPPTSHETEEPRRVIYAASKPPLGTTTPQPNAGADNAVDSSTSTPESTIEPTEPLEQKVNTEILDSMDKITEDVSYKDIPKDFIEQQKIEHPHYNEGQILLQYKSQLRQELLRSASEK